MHVNKQMLSWQSFHGGTLAAIGFAVSVGLCSMLVGHNSGCTAAQKKSVLDALSQIALEVCVEGESVAVCARKCADEAEKRKPGLP